MSSLDFFDSANASCVFWEITVQSSLAWPAMNVMQTPSCAIHRLSKVCPIHGLSVQSADHALIHVLGSAIHGLPGSTVCT